MQFSPAAGLCLAIAMSLAGCGSFGTSKEQYVQRGNTFFDKGQFADATLNYRNALKQDPAYAEAYYRLGLTLSKDASPADALTNLEKAVSLQPDHDAARLALASLYLEGLRYLPTPPQPFYDKLQRIAQGYITKDAKSFHGHRLLGHIAMLDSKPDAAAPHFRAALDAQPDSEEAATLFAQSLLASGKAAEAESFARQTLAARPSFGALYDILYFHYRNTRRLPEAEQLLQQRIAANPKDSLALIQLARHYQSLRLSKPMEETLAKTSALPDGLLASADFLLDSGDTPQAILLYKKGADNASPMQSTFRKRLVSVYLRNNQKSEAAALLETLFQADPKDKEILAARASLRAASGQTAEIDAAIAEFTKLVDADPKSVPYRYDLAYALRMRGRDDDAYTQLLKAIESNPNHLPSLEELAGISIQRARAQDAGMYASRALAINPKSPRTRLIFTAALALVGKSADARQEINSLLREYPNLREAHLQLALLNIQEKRFREAEVIYRQHYTPGQKDTRFLRGLIELAFASGQPEQALQSLQQEVKLQPASAETRMMLAGAAARMNRTDIAIEQFLWLKQNAPPSLNVEMALGLARQQSGDLPAAIAQFQSARKLAPNDPNVAAALAYALQQSGRPGDAVPLYRESLQGKPDAPIVKSNLAMALTDTGGDLQEALLLAQSAAGKEPSNPVFADALGLVYLKRKDTASATQAFRSAVAKSPESVEYRIHLASALLEAGNKAAAKAELGAAAARKPSPAEQTAISAMEAKLR